MPDLMSVRHCYVKENYACAYVAKNCDLSHNAPMRNLRAIRRSKKLSQAALAEMAGCNQGTIAKIEKGTANPTLSLIEDIAAALEVSPAALFGVSDIQARMIAALDAMPEDQKGAALVVLEAMAARDH